MTGVQTCALPISFYVRLPIVIGEQHFGHDGFCCLHQLFCRHRIGLVARHKGDVDVLNVLHLRDVFCVASDVDAQPVDGEDIAIVATFRVEMCTPLGNVIGWYGFYGEVFGYLILSHRPFVLTIFYHTETVIVNRSFVLNLFSMFITDKVSRLC